MQMANKHMMRLLDISLLQGNEHQNHNEMPLTPARTVTMENKCLCISGRKAKWYSHCRKQYGGFPRNQTHNFHMIQQIPLLSIYPKELKAGTQVDMCTPMFITALFITAKK